MKLKTLFRLTLIIVIVGLMACTTFQLRDANEQLISYYYAKQQAEKNNDWRMLEGTIASLSKLAADAANQAVKEGDNVLNQIAFYRIATTAAWQAGETNVFTYADEGQKLCTDNNFKRAPRDCSMLIVFPIFAAVDETTKKFEKLHDKVIGTPADQRKSHAKGSEKILEDYQGALISILKQRPRLAINEAHPDFLKALDRNTVNLLCELMGFNAVGLIATTKGNVNNAKCELYELKKRAFHAGINQSSASCLPNNKEELECEVYKFKKRAFDAGLDQSSVKCLPESEEQLKKPQGCP
jgi:hypothetical protein